jgi:hypothetical protein
MLGEVVVRPLPGVRGEFVTPAGRTHGWRFEIAGEAVA